nr:MAG TPA: hypothetical protein [Caudoviricetes sp.]
MIPLMTYFSCKYGTRISSLSAASITCASFLSAICLTFFLN